VKENKPQLKEVLREQQECLPLTNHLEREHGSQWVEHVAVAVMTVEQNLKEAAVEGEYCSKQQSLSSAEVVQEQQQAQEPV